MGLDVDSAVASALVIGGLALIGVCVSLIVQQQNRRRDAWVKNSAASTAIKVDETRMALESWKDFVRALNDELKSVRTRAEHCENVVVPDLQQAVAHLQDRVAQLESGA